MPDKIQTQREEFDAVDELAKQWRRIQCTPIVDDDYPEVRHGYESALHALVEKMCDNDRFSENTRGALIMLRHLLNKLGVENTMRRYRVYFQWNDRGRSVVDRVVSCVLPPHHGIADVLRGFWVDDKRVFGNVNNWEVDYALTDADSHMWVPPGRITSVVKEES